MQRSIYAFLREMLAESFIKAFPELAPIKFIIPFSAITPEPAIDLATPLPLKISNLYHIPLLPVNSMLTRHIEWNCNYIADNTSDVYRNGFFNFKISEKYLFSSVYKIGTSSSVDTDCPVFYNDKNSILCNLSKLAKQYDSLIKSEPLESFVWELLNLGEERLLMRTISISEPAELHSQHAMEYFRNRLVAQTRVYYSRHPIISKDFNQTSIRLLLVSAICNRLRSLTPG